MSSNKIYKYYVYIAGIKVPFIDLTINSKYGQLSSMNIQLPYSPYIEHLHPFTKITVFEHLIDGGIYNEPTLEFDGIIGAIARQKNLLGQTGLNMTCYTDGFIWERRKQADFYLQELLSMDVRGSGDEINVRSDGTIGNYFTEILKNNSFDAGLAAASVLTTKSKTITTSGGKTDAGSKATGNVNVTLFGEFIYNGKEFLLNAMNSIEGGTSVTPQYYKDYLDTYKLSHKVYGLTTGLNIKKFFATNQFITMICQNMVDVHGENSFYSIAQQVLNYGFYQLFDITNPTYIGPTKSFSTDKINLNSEASMTIKDDVQLSDEQIGHNTDIITVTENRQYAGLGEYVFKPISVLGLPLKCNVIWPDQVVSENIMQDFVSAPTRVLANRKPIAGDNLQNAVLTTQVLVGPRLTTKDGYFKSLVSPVTLIPEGTFRAKTVLSDYEEAYGIKYHMLNMSQAFDETLLQNKILKGQTDESQATKDTAEAMNNYLNYEFSQKFLSSRQYSVQITPDTCPVVGLPTVVMNAHGQHIVAFIFEITKYISALGQKVTNLGIGYPHYAYEDMGILGNVVDPSSTNETSMKEMEIIFGSERLCTLGSTTNQLSETIDGLLDAYTYDASDNKDTIKTNYSRHKSICKLNQYLLLHGKTILSNPETNIPNSLGLFKSSALQDGLSTNHFKVYDYNRSKNILGGETKETWIVTGKSNQDIVKYHLAWTASDQRI